MKRERLTRRKGREAALQLLCHLDAQGFPADCRLEENHFWEIRPTTARARAFAQSLLDGVRARRDAIDRRVVAHLDNYRFSRLALVDRNLLRMAAYEMFERADTPPVVAINEAIEIAKKFSTTESASFINGVLNRLAQSIGRPMRDPSPPASWDAPPAGAGSPGDPAVP